MLEDFLQLMKNMIHRFIKRVSNKGQKKNRMEGYSRSGFISKRADIKG